jgi:hypothetical protein
MTANWSCDMSITNYAGSLLNGLLPAAAAALGDAAEADLLSVVDDVTALVVRGSLVGVVRDLPDSKGDDAYEGGVSSQVLASVGDQTQARAAFMMRLAYDDEGSSGSI